MNVLTNSEIENMEKYIANMLSVLNVIIDKYI